MPQDQADVTMSDPSITVESMEAKLIPEDCESNQSVSPRSYQKEMLEVSLEVCQHCLVWSLMLVKLIVCGEEYHCRCMVVLLLATYLY